MARPISFDPDIVLDEAMSLFWTRGYHRVSVEDIVQNTGLNRHSLYARFGSKFGLLKAVLDRYESAMLERVRAILSESGTARERLKALLTLRAAPYRATVAGTHVAHDQAAHEVGNGYAHGLPHRGASLASGEFDVPVAPLRGAADEATPLNAEVDFWGDVRQRGCLAMRVAAELRDSHSELADEVSHFGTALEDLVAAVLRQGQARGEVRRDRVPEDMASVLVGGFLLPVVYAPAARRTEAFLCVLD